MTIQNAIFLANINSIYCIYNCNMADHLRTESFYVYNDLSLNT